ncbi:MAG: DUF5672 family protein [Bacteroidales bacterium]|nr:DUF5672 family protein [Bacteroidales bacterium]
MSKRIAIVIPVIARSVEGDELQSLRQCLKVLGRRDICFLCSNELDTTFYERACNEVGVPFRKRTFGREWFSGVKAYNSMCFSSMLYEAFAEYEYVLIYQLDAYVFEDRLDEWCARGYDYVGGPWLCHWSQEVENLDHWEVGNGGFCLRRVDTFLRVLTTPRLLHKPLKGIGRLAKENRRRLDQKPWLWPWLAFRALTGYHNTLQYYIKQNGQEDKAFAQCQYNGLMRIPTAREALDFSFDMRPTTCYKMNGNRLPMGCHMWFKYDNESFWYPQIYKNTNG